MGQPAARVGDLHLCPMVTPGLPPIPHVGGPIITPGAPTVVIGGSFAAGLGSTCVCVGPPAAVIKSSTGVMMGGKFSARVGDSTAHGGAIAFGFPSVMVGDNGPGGRPVTILSTNPLKVQYGPFIIENSSNDPAFMQNALAALLRLDSTPTMNNAFNQIQASGNTITMHKYDPSDPFYASLGPNNAYCLEGNPANAGTPGVGSSSTVAWDPGMNSFGSTPSSSPGSDIVLGHELIHGTHNATGTHDYGNPQTPPFGNSQTNEERNTVGLPASTYNGQPGDPLNGTALPDTTAGPNENNLRKDYSDMGRDSPSTGAPPVQRPSYGAPTATDGPGSPF